jgi:hypothetical protein
MKRDPKERFDKVTLNLRKGDADELALMFPNGYSWAIRKLVEAFVDRTKAKREAGQTVEGIET